MRKPYSYIYPGELSSQIFKPMSTNNLRTELDFKEKNDPEMTRSFIIDLLIIMAIVIVCVLMIVFVLLNSEFIDSIKPEYQLVIYTVACGVFGTLRFVIWIREKL